MLRRFYDWTMAAAGHRHALRWLSVVAFVESSFFPIPPDLMIVPMVLADRRRAWIIALVCTVASVLGGILGYAIGYFLFETVGRPLLDFYGYSDKFARFSGYYNDYGAWIVFFFGLTPFPYKVITIASGVTALNPLVFITASIGARGLRFFIVTALLWRFGPPIRDFIERYLGILTTLFFIFLVGGFVAIKYLL